MSLRALLVCVPVVLSVSACGGDGGSGADVPLRILVVNEHGEPVLARRVLYQPQPGDAFWLGAEAATCETGEPAYSEWVVEEAFDERIVVSAERVTEATPTDACQPYASVFATVHPGTRARPSQLLHLTLPSYGTYCIDGETGRAVINAAQAEELDGSDELVTPAVGSGVITLSLVDPQQRLVPGSAAYWYYAPEGPDYDGEHPLLCADLRCETWVSAADDPPRAGTVYLNATYIGPLNPFFQQGWLGYDGAPFELSVDGAGALQPLSVTLTLPTDQEGATGG